MIYRRHICKVCLFMFFMFGAYGYSLSDSGGIVKEYGIYSEERRLIKETKTIPAHKIVRFGFCFEAFVDFYEGDKYMLVQTLTHPKIEDDGGWPNIGYSVPRKFKVVEGIAQGCVDYKARDSNEAPAGDWIFSITDGRVELIKIKFILK